MRFAQGIAGEVGEKELLEAIKKWQLAAQLLVKLVDVQALTPDAAFDEARFFISKIPTPFVALSKRDIYVVKLWFMSPEVRES